MHHVGLYGSGLWWTMTSSDVEVRSCSVVIKNCFQLYCVAGSAWECFIEDFSTISYAINSFVHIKSLIVPQWITV